MIRIRSIVERFLVPALLVMVSVLAALAALRWITVSHPLLYAILPLTPTLLFGGLLLLLVASVATARRILSACSVLLLVPLTMLLWPGGFPPWPVCGDGPSSALLLYSHNVSYESGDPMLVGRQLKEQNPDVVFLQEADDAFVEELQATMEQAYEFRAQSTSGETLSLAVLSRFPLSEVVDTSGDFDQRNPTLAVTIDSPDTPLRIVNFHLSAPRDRGLIARRQDEFAEMRSTHFLDQNPDLVVGDFNSSLAHADFRSTVDAMQGSVVSSCQVGGTWSPLRRGPGLLDLDHAIVIEERLSDPHLQRLGYAGSDHRALLLKIATVG